MASQNSGTRTTFHQAGALPYRRTRRGLEFCLITSTEGRWIFPKGIINPGETYKETASKEALEEAGLRGRFVDRPLGSCEMVKYGKPYNLVLLLMEVTACEDSWEEADFRQRRWAAEDEARRLLCQPQLQNCLDIAVARLKDSKKSARVKRNMKDDRLPLRQANSVKASRAAKRA
jgi:8-oxo-dGTP pyrophosphatase MutT (NUDIX family)